ncbi:MAG TPA: hypothetical protein VF911_14045 [Thermoanaerobaculia bacterium]
MNQSFEEIHVFESVAERTGNRLERAGVRGRAGVCRSVTDLAAKFRRLGDGYYYLAASAWPEGTESLNLVRAWEPLR